MEFILKDMPVGMVTTSTSNAGHRLAANLAQTQPKLTRSRGLNAGDNPWPSLAILKPDGAPLSNWPAQHVLGQRRR